MFLQSDALYVDFIPSPRVLQKLESVDCGEMVIVGQVTDQNNKETVHNCTTIYVQWG